MKTKNKISLISLLTVSIVIISVNLVVISEPVPTNPSKPYTLISSGNLGSLDDYHYGTGVVELIKYEDGSRKFYFKDVFISEGDELHLYLSNKTSVSGSLDSLGNYNDIGEMLIYIGTFLVSIPVNITLSQYNSIIVFCHRCLNIFTYAILG